MWRVLGPPLNDELGAAMGAALCRALPAMNSRQRDMVAQACTRGWAATGEWEPARLLGCASEGDAGSDGSSEPDSAETSPHSG